MNACGPAVVRPGVSLGVSLDVALEVAAASSASRRVGPTRVSRTARLCAGVKRPAMLAPAR